LPQGLPCQGMGSDNTSGTGGIAAAEIV